MDPGQVDPPFVVLLDDCNVRYRGRAEAEQRGVRLVVLVKDDGTIVAHDAASGVSPQFYNPAGVLRTWTRQDRLYIAGESREGEVLKVNGCPSNIVDLAAAADVERSPRRFVGGTEDALVETIRDDPALVGLPGAEFEREERRTGGRVDLYLSEGVVVEVKKRADVSVYDQARRYLRDEDVDRVVLATMSASETLAKVCSEDGEVDLVSIEESPSR